jgi:hypothetical protein
VNNAEDDVKVLCQTGISEPGPGNTRPNSSTVPPVRGTPDLIPPPCLRARFSLPQDPPQVLFKRRKKRLFSQWPPGLFVRSRSFMSFSRIILARKLRQFGARSSNGPTVTTPSSRPRAWPAALLERYRVGASTNPARTGFNSTYRAQSAYLAVQQSKPFAASTTNVLICVLCRQSSFSSQPRVPVGNARHPPTVRNTLAHFAANRRAPAPRKLRPSSRPYPVGSR